MASIRFMHLQTPQTSARSDELTRLSWFMHPWSCGCQRIRASYLDL